MSPMKSWGKYISKLNISWSGVGGKKREGAEQIVDIYLLVSSYERRRRGKP